MTRATPDPDTVPRLTEHRIEPPLDKIGELGDETPRGTFGRGRLSVGVGDMTPALDDSLAVKPPESSLAPNTTPLPDSTPVPTSVEPLASRALLSEPSTMVTIGGSATMSLTTFNRAAPFHRMRDLDRAETAPAIHPSPASMRFMETGLALVAITVALLLNLGR